MASYEMQESNLPNEEGRRILYPRMVSLGKIDLKELAEMVGKSSTYSAAEVKGVVDALLAMAVDYMGMGYSVKIDGLGTLRPSLGLRKGFERESGEKGDTRRNATAIHGRGVPVVAVAEEVQAVVHALHRAGTAGVGTGISGEAHVHDGGRIWRADGAAAHVGRPRAAAMGRAGGQRHRHHGARLAPDICQEGVRRAYSSTGMASTSCSTARACSTDATSLTIMERRPDCSRRSQRRGYCIM